MTPSRLLLLTRLRRHSPSTLSYARASHLLLYNNTCHERTSIAQSRLLFSTRSIDDDDNYSTTESAFSDSINESLLSSGFTESLASSGISSSISSDDVVGGYTSILPVEKLASLLDSYHELSGLPWWLVIASSTLAMRLTLLPVVIMQLHKLKRIAELFPKLPPPFPPPLSGKSYLSQLALFQREKRAIGCPSFFWFLSSLTIQLPCFLLWVSTIRKMSLDHHPGFDCKEERKSLQAVNQGGVLWFQNLTELPNGVFGSIFPVLIAGLHYTNIQISFHGSSFGNDTSMFGTLAKYYKRYLDVLTIPLFFVGYYIPQGSLVYWVTNSSFTVIQQLTLKHPDVRAKLGLPDKAKLLAPNPEKMLSSGVAPTESPKKWKKIAVQHLVPRELLALSVKLLSDGYKDRAIPLIRLALDKDPNYVRAMIVMGQTLYQKRQHAEATEYLERAISKIFLAGHPTTDEEVDDLILASQWAGIALIQQKKNAEGIIHLERIAHMKVPEDPKIKAHYFDGLVMLGSALYNEGRKLEAANHLRIAAAYNPDYRELLEQCENDEDNNLVNDLSNSRRADY
ncbi:hypothetical protein ACFE04_029976 [Oxalis oulophora]